jgi:hypothetical protein
VSGPVVVGIGDGGELAWVPIRDATEKPTGIEIGVPAAQPHIRYMDGWQITVLVPPVRAAGREGSGVALVHLAVPDYPSEDGQITVMGAPDARKLAAQLIQTAADAEQMQRQLLGPFRHEAAMAEARRRDDAQREEVHEVTRCAEPGCNRDRRFFTEAGVGYCKRHAEERGFRPSGKVQ